MYHLSPDWKHIEESGFLYKMSAYYLGSDKFSNPLTAYKLTLLGKKVVMSNNYWYLDDYFTDMEKTDRGNETFPTKYPGKAHKTIQKIADLEGQDLSLAWKQFLSKFGKSARCKSYCR